MSEDQKATTGDGANATAAIRGDAAVLKSIDARLAKLENLVGPNPVKSGFWANFWAWVRGRRGPGRRADIYRATYGILVVFGGFAVLTLLVWITLGRVDISQSGVTGAGTILGLVVSPIVSITAAYFGIQAVAATTQPSGSKSNEKEPKATTGD